MEEYVSYALADNVLGIFGIILAAVVLMFGAYKKIGALPLMILGGLIVALFNGMAIWDAFSIYFMRGGPVDVTAIEGRWLSPIGGYLGFFNNLFLIFAASTFYTKAMEETGSIVKVGRDLTKWFGAKRAVLVVLIATALLTYGGISLFVVVLAVAPLIMVLFKEANLPRSLAIGPLAAGAITFTMKSLPSSPQATNVIPANFLGTDVNAAWGLGLLSAVLMLAGQIWYLHLAEKKVRASGDGFDYMEGTKEENYEVDESTLPSTFAAFLPLVTVVVLIIGLSMLARNGHITVAVNAIVAGSMLLAGVLSMLLNIPKIKGVDHIKYIFNEAGFNAIKAISGPAAVVGFGGLVQGTPAFRAIVESLLGLEMNSYALAATGLTVLSAVMGSSSGALQVGLEALSEPFNAAIANGASVEVIHRISSMFAGTLDSLPHSTVWFLILPTLGVTHKEGYKYAFWTTIVIPTLVGIAILGLAMVLYAY